MKQDDKYFRRTFAIKPGKQLVEISYLDYNAFGAAKSSYDPVPTEFTAEVGRKYRPFHLEFEDLIRVANHPNVWDPVIWDITDDQAIQNILKNSPYPNVRLQAIPLSGDKTMLTEIAEDDPNRRVRKTAKDRLQELAY